MQLKVYRGNSPLAGLVVAHGAGGGQNTSFMVRTAEGLAARGITAATFDFPYMVARKSVPDRPPVLEQKIFLEYNALAIDLYLTVIGKLKSGDDAEQRRFSAAGRPDQHK